MCSKPFVANSGSGASSLLDLELESHVASREEGLTRAPFRPPRESEFGKAVLAEAETTSTTP